MKYVHFHANKCTCKKLQRLVLANGLQTIRLSRYVHAIDNNTYTMPIFPCVTRKIMWPMINMYIRQPLCDIDFTRSSSFHNPPHRIDLIPFIFIVFQYFHCFYCFSLFLTVFHWLFSMACRPSRWAVPRSWELQPPCSPSRVGRKQEVGEGCPRLLPLLLHRIRHRRLYLETFV